MSKVKGAAWTAADYERAARQYSRSLPLEHFMEAQAQARQREITVESLALVHAQRPEIQYFNELLVQYFFEGQLHRVVPDNMVRICREEVRTRGSFNLDLEPVGPFLVLEYVSGDSRRKDYQDSFAKYERELKVPYCLMFYPERQDLQVWHHNGETYEHLTAAATGRYAIPELELEVGLLDGWVRYWQRGSLLPLPADLLQEVAQQERRADQEQQRANQEREARVAAEAEVVRLRALLEKSGQSSPRRSRRQK
jgi:Uma2 family endonuclease